MQLVGLGVEGQADHVRWCFLGYGKDVGFDPKRECHVSDMGKELI